MRQRAEELINDARNDGRLEKLENGLESRFSSSEYHDEILKEVRELVARRLERTPALREQLISGEIEDKDIDKIYMTVVAPELSDGTAGLIIDDYVKKNEQLISDMVDSLIMDPQRGVGA